MFNVRQVKELLLSNEQMEVFTCLTPTIQLWINNEGVDDLDELVCGINVWIEIGDDIGQGRLTFELSNNGIDDENGIFLCSTVPFDKVVDIAKIDPLKKQWMCNFNFSEAAALMETLDKERYLLLATLAARIDALTSEAGQG